MKVKNFNFKSYFGAKNVLNGDFMVNFFRDEYNPHNPLSLWLRVY